MNEKKKRDAGYWILDTGCLINQHPSSPNYFASCFLFAESELLHYSTFGVLPMDRDRLCSVLFYKFHIEYRFIFPASLVPGNHPVSSDQYPASSIHCSFLREKNTTIPRIPTGDILILPPYGTISERTQPCTI
jgi:hypothetical protein